jgi:hypothetical protein
MEIMKPLASFLAFFAAIVRRQSGPLTQRFRQGYGTAIIREDKYCQAKPDALREFLEQTPPELRRSGSPDAGQTPRVPLRRVSMRWMRRYNSCATHDHFQRLRFRRACVQPRLIIAVSRLAVSSDITGAMGAMQEAELVVTA